MQAFPGAFGAADLGAREAGEPTGAIRGVVLDGESGEPLRAAQVAAIDPAEGTRLGAVLSDPDGTFLLRELPAGEVRLEVTYVGYGVGTVDSVEVIADQVVDAGEVLLAVEAIRLEGLGVESRRSAVSFEVDRTVYRLDEMPTVGGGSMSDALAAVPELDVDFEGRVEFEGNVPEIYINGRPAPVDGEALAVFLEQFPADRIERVEVLPNPSARYDAEGAGGIVNVVLAEDVELGLSGSVFANAGTRGTAGSGGRLAWQRGALTLQGGTFLRHTDRETRASEMRENLIADPVTRLEQDRINTQGGLTGGLDLNAEFAPSERVLLWSRGQYNDLGSDSDGVTLTRRTDAAGDPVGGSLRSTASDRDRRSLDLRAGVQVDLDAGERDHEFSVEVRRDVRSTDTYRNQRSEAWDGDEAVYGPVLDLELDDLDLASALRLDEILEDRSRTRVQLDYTRPLGATQLEVGVRGQYRDTEHAREVADGGGAPAEIQGFQHRERFHSAFATVARPLGPVGVQLGVRVELSDVSLMLPDGVGAGARAPAEARFDQRYTSVFPNANLSWRIDDARTLRLSYGQRIRRPWPGRLNPIDRSDDPLTREVGNPDLEPQYTHNVRLDASWRGSLGTLRVTPFYRYTANEWAELRSVDAEGVATETWENVSTTHQLGSSLSFAVRDLAGWGGTLRLSGRQEFRDDARLDLDAGGSTALRWSVRGNVDRSLTRNVSAQARVNYNPAREIPQGWVSSSLMTQFGIRARLLDRRASINLSVRDPFNLYDRTFESRDATHRQLRATVRDTRAATLSVSYALGSPGGR